MNIQGQAALVTGAASGLGEATARELARLGAKVAVLDVNMALAEKVAAEINGIACQCDITNADSVTAAIEKAAAAHGPARILMNVAGIGGAKRVVQKDGSARKYWGYWLSWWPSSLPHSTSFSTPIGRMCSYIRNGASV